MEIVCDTNFLIKIFNDPLPKFDLKSLLKDNVLLTLPGVLRELQGLTSSSSRKTSRRAKKALNSIHSTGFIERLSEPDGPEVDFTLLEFVGRKPAERIVATIDGSLLRSLENRGLGYLTLSSDRGLIHYARQQRI